MARTVWNARFPSTPNNGGHVPFDLPFHERLRRLLRRGAEAQVRLEVVRHVVALRRQGAREVKGRKVDAVARVAHQVEEGARRV